MPMTSEVGLVVRHNDEMEGARRDRAVTSRAGVVLAGVMGLNRADCYPQIAHANSPITRTTVAATRTRSKASLRACRKGLNPIKRTLTVDSYRPLR